MKEISVMPLISRFAVFKTWVGGKKEEYLILARRSSVDISRSSILHLP
jgi:hypothetical protein